MIRNLPLESGHCTSETRFVHWKRITLVGVGLLGGSLGQAIRRRKLADSVVGYVRRSASIPECEAAGAVDWATRDLEKAVQGADLIVLCTPIGQMEGLAQQMLPNLMPGSIVTDVGSVKAGIVTALESRMASAGVHFIGSHPMAGAEKTGVSAARSDLFLKAVCIVTPTAKSKRAALIKVERLWRNVGSRVIRLTPQAHDELVSRSSHLPHIIAAQLSNFVLGPDHPRQQAMLCANGFRDTTRIASGSPEMWRDIALANRDNLQRVLGAFTEELQVFQRMLKAGDAAAISRFFEQAKERRDHWACRAGSPSPE